MIKSSDRAAQSTLGAYGRPAFASPAPAVEYSAGCDRSIAAPSPETMRIRCVSVRRALLARSRWRRRRMEKHRLALQISDNDPAKMNAVLNVAANVSKYYSDKGDEVEIEIVAFNAGLNMLREDKSPVLTRLKSFKQGMPNVSSWPARTRSPP